MSRPSIVRKAIAKAVRRLPAGPSPLDRLLMTRLARGDARMARIAFFRAFDGLWAAAPLTIRRSFARPEAAN